ncbi:hypothetical protein V2J09_009611 [Rumex salicifolius]
MTSGSNEQTQGLFARGQGNDRGNSKREKSRSLAETRCYKCGELGHWKKDCHNKRVQWKDKNNKNKGDQDVKHEASVASDEFGWRIPDALIICVQTGSGSLPIKAVNGGTVLMGNDHGCETVGIGTFRIKKHDGIVRTLMDVRHVPDLRKNLISLGVLESKGCKLIGEKGF